MIRIRNLESGIKNQESEIRDEDDTECGEGSDEDEGGEVDGERRVGEEDPAQLRHHSDSLSTPNYFSFKSKTVVEPNLFGHHPSGLLRSLGWEEVQPLPLLLLVKDARAFHLSSLLSCKID